MSGLDNLIAFIDNGGTRSGSERRRFSEDAHMPERRMQYDRRSGADRRRSLNRKRKRGKERRTVFVDWHPTLRARSPQKNCKHTPTGNPQIVKSDCPVTPASDGTTTRENFGAEPPRLSRGRIPAKFWRRRKPFGQYGTLNQNPIFMMDSYCFLSFVTSILSLSLHNCPLRSWFRYSMVKVTPRILFLTQQIR